MDKEYYGCLSWGRDIYAFRPAEPCGIVSESNDKKYLTILGAMDYRALDSREWDRMSLVTSQKVYRYIDEVLEAYPLSCPQTGAFEAYFYTWSFEPLCEQVIIKLLVPADARRSGHIGSYCCRCDRAVILEIYGASSTPDNKWKPMISFKDLAGNVYKAGTILRAKFFEEDRMSRLKDDAIEFVTDPWFLRYMPCYTLNEESNIYCEQPEVGDVFDV